MTVRITTIFLIAILFITSCANDNDDILRIYNNGILVSGEGSFSGESGSVSFISNDFQTVENKIYESVNNSTLGSFLQSIAFDESRAFIVVDNSNTITVTNRFSFEEITRITSGLSTPRYMTIYNNKGYVTNWGNTSSETDDFIAVINLDTYTLESKIPVGNGPERIVRHNKSLYISHKGGFTTNNIISVINTDNNTVQEITVNDNPDELLFNNSDELVVLCEGRTLFDENFNITGHTLGSITTINTSTNTITKTIDFKNEDHPNLMDIQNDVVYYALNGNIYKLNTSDTTLPNESFISTNVSLYGMSTDESYIYITHGDFVSLSNFDIYDISTKEKTTSKKVALGASKIYFNE